MTGRLRRNRQRIRFTMRLVLVFSLLLLIAVCLRYPHTVRAIMRRPPDAGAAGDQLVRSHYPAYSGEVLGDCLPAWDTVTDPNYTAFLDTPTFDLDPEGVLLQNYKEDFDIAQWQYQPYSIAMYGMIGMQAWCQDNDTVGLEIAVRQADWLVANAHYQPYATWLYDFPNSGFSAPSGWWSSLANSVAIVLLVQVHAVVGNADYLDVAASALDGFEHTIAEGGVQALMPDGVSIFFEEVASSSSPPSHILNGHILAVFGLAYYADYVGGGIAPQLVSLGTDAVRNTMNYFDAGDRTYYSLNPAASRPVTHYAHPIHVRGLRWMAERTNDPAFSIMADHWEAMDGAEW